MGIQTSLSLVCVASADAPNLLCLQPALRQSYRIYGSATSSNLFPQLTSGRRFTIYLQVSRPAPSLLGSVYISAYINTITYHSRYLDALGANGAGEIHDSAQRAPTPLESSLPLSDRIHRYMVTRHSTIWVKPKTIGSILSDCAIPTFLVAGGF